jgi:crotonobetainyl-CoA:carnitine CoA-transferase CaiB-like acyl-CoA transferase
MVAGEGAGSRLEDQIAAEIYKVANRTDLTPDELFVAGLRFIQSAKRSNFKKLLAPALAEWAREHWTYVIEKQQFYLRNPSTAVPPIKEALAASGAELAFVGKLLVAIEPAVNPRIDQQFREFLLSL